MELASLPNGLELYTESPTEAEYLYKEMYEHGCYDSFSLPDDPFVLDVGANIGMFSLYTKQRYPTAEIIAFEPIPVTRDILRRNIALHGLTGITVEDCALGEKAENDVVFTHYPRLPGNSTRYPEQKQLQIDVCLRLYPEDDTIEQHQGYEVHVPVDRLSRRLPAGRRVDLLKVDVEGAEYEVLLGIDAADWPRIDRLIVEVQDLDGRLDLICGFLRDKGYRTEVGPSPMVEEEILTFLVTAVREGL
ncbi:FkbM family methyltransferase [Streptomyces hoynatensis]|nr:FkbM family methyltransferase [Streptomyces hoynatensis]